MELRRKILARLRCLEQRLEWARPEMVYQRSEGRRQRIEAMVLEVGEVDSSDAEITKLNAGAATTRSARARQSVQALAWSREVRRLKEELKHVVDEGRKSREDAYSAYLENLNKQEGE